MKGHPSDSESLQRDHYDAIAEAYDLHYGDDESLAYRREFMHAPLLDGIDLAGKRVLEAMCGSGPTTDELVERGAEVTGLDISEGALASFRARHPTCRAIAGSILDTGLPDASFDAVVIVGGLHHLHPHVDDALVEIHRLLAPGGHLCFAEPHTGSLADRARRVWYRRDPLFASNEAAIDVEALARRHAERFELTRLVHGGGPAYLFVLNSLVFRVPHAWKRRYARPMLAAERLLAPLQGRLLSIIAFAQLRARTPAPR